MAENMSYYDLLAAFEKEECAVCRLTLKAVNRYIESVNYESVGDPQIRMRLRESLGFCNLHAHQWLHSAFVLGTAQIYRDVLETTSSELRGLSSHRSGVLAGLTSFFGTGTDSDGRSSISPRARCVICDVRDTVQGELITTIAAGLSKPQFAEAYRTSGGLCLLHLRPAFHEASPDGFEVLKKTAIATEAKLDAQLAEVIRKHDYRFANEPVLEERGSGERAINHVIGIDGLAQ
jgi:hypothetical protein